MWYHIVKPTIQDLMRTLNGVLVGSANLWNGADVDGKTLILDVGSGNQTITFAPALGTNWTIDQIVSQINATISGVASRVVRTSQDPTVTPTRQLTLSHKNGIKVRSTGTANADLGFSVAADTEQQILVANDVKAVGKDNTLGSWFAIYTD